MNIWKNLTPTGKIATSLILKDAVGCYLYVNQARSNKKFTPQQRADVANYDLANGVINIGLQLLAVKPIENLMERFSKSKLVKHFQYSAQKSDTPIVKQLLKKAEQNKKWVKGSVALMSVLICQYFIKRVVSPFFSVPAGEKTKQWGLVKPKVYPGETFTGAGDTTEAVNINMPEGNKNTEKPRFDVMSYETPDSNLVHRAQHYYSTQRN